MAAKARPSAPGGNPGQVGIGKEGGVFQNGIGQARQRLAEVRAARNRAAQQFEGAPIPAVRHGDLQLGQTRDILLRGAAGVCKFFPVEPHGELHPGAFNQERMAQCFRKCNGKPVIPSFRLRFQ